MLIRALINIGANVNEADSEGQTPLMAAASWGNASSVRILVKEGKANLDVQDDGGDTALHEAAREAGLLGGVELHATSLPFDDDRRNR